MNCCHLFTYMLNVLLMKYYPEILAIRVMFINEFKNYLDPVDFHHRDSFFSSFILFMVHFHLTPDLLLCTAKGSKNWQQCEIPFLFVEKKEKLRKLFPLTCTGNTMHNFDGDVIPKSQRHKADIDDVLMFMYFWVDFFCLYLNRLIFFAAPFA